MLIRLPSYSINKEIIYTHKTRITLVKNTFWGKYQHTSEFLNPPKRKQTWYEQMRTQAADDQDQPTVWKWEQLKQQQDKLALLDLVTWRKIRIINEVCVVRGDNKRCKS